MGLVAPRCVESLEQGSHPCPLHWQANSHPLYQFEMGVPVWKAFGKELKESEFSENQKGWDRFQEIFELSRFQFQTF